MGLDDIVHIHFLFTQGGRRLDLEIKQTCSKVQLFSATVFKALFIFRRLGSENLSLLAQWGSTVNLTLAKSGVLFLNVTFKLSLTVRVLFHRKMAS